MDWDEVRKTVGERCFVCELIAANPEFAHHVVYEDERSIAFLNRYPPLYGYVLVASREHREQVTGDFSEEEYVALQRIVHRVGEAIRRAIPTERLYVCSLSATTGSVSSMACSRSNIKPREISISTFQTMTSFWASESERAYPRLEPS